MNYNIVKTNALEGTMEIITQSVMKREITDLENAGVANLMLRENPLVEETKNEGNNKSFNQFEK